MALPLPTIAKIWKQLLSGGAPGLRVPFVSVTDAAQNLAFQIFDFLTNSSGASTKYTHVWSCSGGTGPTNAADHTVRITNAASWTPQGAGAGNSQAFFVVSGANGEQVLVANQGGTGDVFRVAFSPGGLYTLAATTNQQPTATDEIVVLTGVSVVNATASADRIIHLWARDDAKGFRVLVARSSAMAAPCFFVEEVTRACTTDATAPVLVSIANATMGGCFNSANIGSPTGPFGANACGAGLRVTVGGVSATASCFFTSESQASNHLANKWTTTPPKAQGGAWAPYLFGLGSDTAGFDGLWARVIDMWELSLSGLAFGDGFGSSYQFMHVPNLLWPNPSNVQPLIA